MEYLKLGTTDIKVSVMALGCWPFAGGMVWGEQDEGESIATVHAALDAGINFFDTAESYEEGHSERVLGRGLAGRRQQAVIATKVSPNHLSPEGIAAACEQSLKNLQTLGVANFASNDLADLVAVGRPAANQLPYSLLWRAIEFEVLARCRERDIGLICYAPLAQGLLTGRYAAADEVPDGLARTRWYAGSRPQAKHGEQGCEEAVFHAIAGIRDVSERVGAPLASVALAWVLKQRGVTSLLVGARNPDELARNLPALALDLDAATMAELERLTEPVKEAVGRNLDMWSAESRMR